MVIGKTVACNDVETVQLTDSSVAGRRSWPASTKGSKRLTLIPDSTGLARNGALTEWQMQQPNKIPVLLSSQLQKFRKLFQQKNKKLQASRDAKDQSLHCRPAINYISLL